MATFVNNKNIFKTRDFNITNIGWNFILDFTNIPTGSYLIAITLNQAVNDIQLVINGAYTQIGQPGQKNGTLVFSLSAQNTVSIYIYSNSIINDMNIKATLQKIS